MVLAAEAEYFHAVVNVHRLQDQVLRRLQDKHHLQMLLVLVLVLLVLVLLLV